MGLCISLNQQQVRRSPKDNPVASPGFPSPPLPGGKSPLPPLFSCRSPPPSFSCLTAGSSSAFFDVSCSGFSTIPASRTKEEAAAAAAAADGGGGDPKKDFFCTALDQKKTLFYLDKIRTSLDDPTSTTRPPSPSPSPSPPSHGLDLLPATTTTNDHPLLVLSSSSDFILPPHLGLSHIPDTTRSLPTASFFSSSSFYASSVFPPFCFDSSATQRLFIRRIDSKKTTGGACYYLVTSSWIDKWKQFVTLPGTRCPGPISNDALLGADGQPKSDFRPGIQYRGVNEHVWRYWWSLYGGGPCIKRRTLDLYAEPVAIQRTDFPVCNYRAIHELPAASPPPAIAGLFNLGNTCFMNGALQCLAAVPALDISLRAVFAGRGSALVTAICRLLEGLSSGGPFPIRHSYLPSAMRTAATNRGKVEKDSVEEDHRRASLGRNDAYMSTNSKKGPSNESYIPSNVPEDNYDYYMSSTAYVTNTSNIPSQYYNHYYSSPSYLCDYYSPRDLVRQLRSSRYVEQFDEGSQEDAHEFLRMCLDVLHEEELKLDRTREGEEGANGNGEKMSKESKFKKGHLGGLNAAQLEEVAKQLNMEHHQALLYWSHYLRNNNSLVSRLFAGQLRSRIRCCHCGYHSDVFEPFWDLSLPMPTDTTAPRPANGVRTTADRRRCAEGGVDTSVSPNTQGSRTTTGRSSSSIATTTATTDVGKTGSATATTSSTCLLSPPLTSVAPTKVSGFSSPPSSSSFLSSMSSNSSSYSSPPHSPPLPCIHPPALPSRPASPLSYCSSSSCPPLSLCLSLFLSAEQLDMTVCGRCQTPQRPLKQLHLTHSPYVLLLHFNRFNPMNLSKLHTRVDFPIDTLDLQTQLCGAQYRLFAVLEHSGAVDSGHYVAYVLKQNRKWYRFDDEVVEEVSRSCVQSAIAYCLFYHRDPPLPAHPTDSAQHD